MLRRILNYLFSSDGDDIEERPQTEQSASTIPPTAVTNGKKAYISHGTLVFNITEEELKNITKPGKPISPRTINRLLREDQQTPTK
jgi:hypothetical protein